LESWQSKTKKNPIKISCLGTKQSFSEQEIFFTAIVKTAKEHEKCNIKLYEKFTQFKSKTNRD